EILGLDDGEHRPENLLLGNPRFGRDVGNHGRLDEVPWPRELVAARDQAPFALADFDVLQYGLLGVRIDDRAHVDVFVRGRTHLDPLHARLELVQERVVDLLDHDGARAGGALLALEAEGRNRYALDRRIQVRLAVNHDGVLAPHLRDDALDPDLPGNVLGGKLVDTQADLLRACEGDIARARMRNQRVAHHRARPRKEVHHAGRHARLLEGL